MTATPTLTIVIGSTRPGRSGLPIATWFADQARVHGGFDITVVDLADLDLPLMDEPNHPLFQMYTQEHTKAWSETVASSDAFVFVSPEYNNGYAAPLKNALDYLVVEWADKAVGFVSYGGVSGGTRAVAQLKPVVSFLKMVPVTEAVIIPFHSQRIDADGTFQSDDATDQAALAMLNEIARVDGALSTLRKA